MRANLPLLLFLVPTLALALAGAASPTQSENQYDGHLSSSHPPEEVLIRRDGDHDHAHKHGAAPLLVLNETEISMSHQPTPPSYWSIDIQDRKPEDHRYPGLMLLHALFMGLAFFGALPIGTVSSTCSVRYLNIDFFLSFRPPSLPFLVTPRYCPALCQARLARLQRDSFLCVCRSRFVSKWSLQKNDAQHVRATSLSR